MITLDTDYVRAVPKRSMVVRRLVGAAYVIYQQVTRSERDHYATDSDGLSDDEARILREVIEVLSDALNTHHPQK